MNVMGIGPQEMMIIAVIALLVFGPGKLPEVMGQAGKLVRDFRRMSAELSGEFEKTIAEARDATGGLAAELGGMSKEVSSVTNSVKKDLGIKNSRATASGTKAAAGKTTTGSKSTSSKSAASSTSKSSTSTNKAGSKAGSTTAAKSTSTTSTASKKPVTPVATREDPTADMFLYEPKRVERVTRSRKAVPSVIGDPTPRISDIVSTESEAVTVATAPNTSLTSDDAISRARQRRRNAGYARAAV
ncbi:MAG TPA: twin-arginine translocase TatA/TatE family subunit [Thermomicrobiales bacterium]|nr:twin-arginine translocase TatA/TatE family subunit [Thermomicrobiales bacterium]